MKRAEFLEYKWKYSQMDPDFIVDALNLSSQELLTAFADKFEEFLKEEYRSEREEKDPTEEGYTGRSDFEEGP